jgi:ABC-type branched-subunit amino acid transport system substrate-binding protein
MTRHKPSLVIAPAVFALLAGSGLALAPAASAAPSPIVIAVEGPLTGSQSDTGIDMYRGVKLAVDQVNAKGGVLGRQVKIVKSDDQANPDLALAAAKKVKAAGAVAVIGPFNSSVGLVNLPYYVSNKVVALQLTSTDDTTGEGVTIQPKNSQISPVEIDYLQNGYGYTGCPKVVMLVDPSAYTAGMADRIGKAMMCGDGKPVAAIPVVPGQADYTAAVASALALTPDILYVSTYFPEGSKIATAIAASKTAAHCFMGLANVDPAFVTGAGIPASQNCRFSGVPDAAQMPDAKTYVAAYKKAFKAQPGVWGTFTYDSANILFAAMTKANSTDYSAVMKKVLATKGFAGQTGTITINPKTGNRTKVPVYILKVDKSGTFVIDTDAP